MAKDDDNIKNPESTGGKISEGMDGVGRSTKTDVRARAEELAADDGLSPHDVDERYLSQAREEMTGGNVPADDVLPEADEWMSVTRSWARAAITRRTWA